MWLVEILRDLGSVLRYYASALVAVVLVWTFDTRHDAFLRAFDLAWPQSRIPPWSPLGWVLLGLLALLGVISYFVHRVIHRSLIAPLMLRLEGAGERVTLHELDFARSMRRDSEARAVRSIQNGLDLLNASAHFFYCSALASALLALWLEYALDHGLALPWHFSLPLTLLLLAGFITDRRACRGDLDAWRRFGPDGASATAGHSGGGSGQHPD